MYSATISHKRRLPGWLAIGGAALLTVMVLSIAVILLLQPGQQTRQNMPTAQAQVTSTPPPAIRPLHTPTVAYVPAMATHPPQPAPTPRPQPVVAFRPQPPVIPQPHATPQPPPQPKHKRKPDK